MSFLVTIQMPALDEDLVSHAVHAIETGLLSDSEVIDMLTDDLVRRSILEVIANGD